MTKLTLFNSLTRKKEAFEPEKPDDVRLYACGPTVYNYAHIGNARMAVVFDLLARVLKTQFPKVTYVSNITDVDDKIIAASAETGEAIDVITEKYAAIYNEDMAALGCAEPDIQPRATAYIGEMIAMIERLIEKGHAYEADGHVLFEVSKFPAYGALSRRSRDEQIAGARVEVASYKKDPADFVLWKPSSDDEPGWDSPWGRGRPGWHIECSAMAEKHLGLPFDIHGGGADLKFPHHENEIAQSCCANGTEDDPASFAKVWVHNGFLTVEGEKMSKSLGNFLLAHDLLKKHSGPVLRLTLLSAQYRKPLDWSEKKVSDSKKLYDKIQSLLSDLWDVKEDTEGVYGDFYSKFESALCDDLNVPLALSELNVLLSSLRKDIDSGRMPDHLGIQKYQLLKMLDILGIEIIAQEEIKLDSDLEDLLAERAQAKADKNWARADEIRDEIAAQGYEIIDTPEGAQLKKI